MDDNSLETYPQENEVEISGANQIKSPTTANLNQTLSDINSNLSCMSKILIKHATDPDESFSVVSQSPNGREFESTGQTDFFSTRQFEKMFTGHKEQSSSTGVSETEPTGNRDSFPSPTGLSRVKRPLGLALSSKHSNKVCFSENGNDKLAQALETPSDVPDNVHPKLVSLLNSRWGKAVPSVKLSPIFEQYNRPENCTNLFSVKVNKEA